MFYTEQRIISCSHSLKVNINDFWSLTQLLKFDFHLLKIISQVRQRLSWQRIDEIYFEIKPHSVKKIENETVSTKLWAIGWYPFKYCGQYVFKCIQN